MSAHLFRIGLISDTHGLLRPQASAALRGSAAILHAGDIGAPDVLEALGCVAPVTAIRGNNDCSDWARDFPDCTVVQHGPARIYVLHDRNDLARFPAPAGCNVVVTGHSHQPMVERASGVLYVNPGSAGPRRFRLPVTIAFLDIGATIEARIVHLDVGR